MKKTRLTLSIAAVGLLAGVVWFYRKADGRELPAYRFATVDRGNVRQTVAATGSLRAVTTVAVGTQVSGQLSAIYVDFNSKVKKGQLLARIDPTLQLQAVADARAGVERSQALLEAAKGEYDRNKQLFDQQIVTAAEFSSFQSNYAVAQANLKSAQIALDRAQQNLSYTAIYAPINGVVVERNVDVGQTVAASLSAPQLFLIANDLTEMQILASVDESDIGRIAEGQAVSFTVQAHGEDTFSGTVRQVRLQSTTTDNVVSYTVVVGVKNVDRKLMPGMTATVKFVTSTADDVLTVPNAAVRMQPTAEMLAQVSAGRPAPGAAQSAEDTARVAGVNRGRGGSPGAAAGGASSAGQTAGAGRSAAAGRSVAALWYLDAQGTLARMPVRTGLSDGQKTQVTGPSLQAGMRVIVGTATQLGASTSTPSTTASPFQAPQRSGPRGPGGF